MGNGCAQIGHLRRIGFVDQALASKTMPRYVVERTFPEGLEIPADAQGAKACLGIVERNGTSFVAADRALQAAVAWRSGVSVAAGVDAMTGVDPISDVARP